MNTLTSIITSKAHAISTAPVVAKKDQDKEILLSLFGSHLALAYGKYVTSDLTDRDVKTLELVVKFNADNSPYNRKKKLSVADVAAKVALLPKDVILFLEACTWDWRLTNPTVILSWLQIRPKTNLFTPSQVITLTEQGIRIPTGFKKFVPEGLPAKASDDVSKYLLAAAALFDVQENYKRYSGNSISSVKYRAKDWVKLFTEAYSTNFISNLKPFETTTLASAIVSFLKKAKLQLDIKDFVFPVATPLNERMYDINQFPGVQLSAALDKTENASSRNITYFSVAQLLELLPEKQHAAVFELLRPFDLSCALRLNPKTKELHHPLTKANALDLVQMLATSAQYSKIQKAQKPLIKAVLSVLTPAEIVNYVKELTPYFYSFWEIKALSILGLNEAEIMEASRKTEIEEQVAEKLARQPEVLATWLKAGARMPFLLQNLQYVNTHPYKCNATEYLENRKPFLLTLASSTAVVEALHTEDASALSSLLDLIKHQSL